MRSEVFFLLSFVIALGRADCVQKTYSDPKAFSKTNFDYLIVGAGTAGLVLARRLSEKTSLKVGVIEAGQLHDNDPLLDIPGNSGQAGSNPNYAWSFTTEAQPGAGGREIRMPRGKLLGGSSALNAMAWNRASKAEYDAWDSFAPGKGWNWDGLLPHFRDSEAIYGEQLNGLPSVPPEQASAGNNPDEVGGKGPINVSYNDIYLEPVSVLVETLNTLNITTNPNPNAGNVCGVTNTRSNIDRKTGTRSYATAYFCSGAPQANLRVLVNATATKLIFDGHRNKDARVTGVKFQSGSKLYTVNVKKEVILAAGVYQSPQLLELSGIGQRKLLTSLKIPTVVDLPAVGENLQDHLCTSLMYEVNEGVTTFDDLKNNATFASEQMELYNKNKTGLFAASNSVLTLRSLRDLAVDADGFRSLVKAFNKTVSQSKLSDLQRMQYDLQRRWLSAPDVPAIEYILFNNALGPAGNKSHISVLACAMHHLDRGSVHINTTDIGAPPVIDPRWLSNDFDVQVLLAGFKFLGNLVDRQPFAEMIKGSPLAVPIGAMSDSDIISRIRNSVGSAQHPMGSLAMGPRKKGGVLDGELRVYGTSNLRVADASIFPVAPGAHLQATVYAVAEKLASMILASHGRP